MRPPLFFIFVALVACAHGGCLPATWEQVCDRREKKCTIIQSVCPPQNNIMSTIRFGSMSRVGDAGYVIEYWPYSGCAYDNSNGANNTFARCKDVARSNMLSLEAAVASDPSWTPDPSDWQEWEVAEVAASNLVIQGFNGNVNFLVRLSPSTIEANAMRGGPGALCRLFWLTGKNVTIRNLVSDTTDCCNYFQSDETSVADCTPIVCTGADCSNLKVEKSRFRGVGAAVRIERDDQGMCQADNVVISIDEITTFNNYTLPKPISLVYFDAGGSAEVYAPGSIVYAKVGTYDTTFKVSPDTAFVNISGIVSAQRALYVLDNPNGEYKHESPQNVYEVAIIMAAILLGGLLVLLVMSLVVSSLKKEIRSKHD